MATVVNKTTFEVLESVNTPDYDPAIWLINPPGLFTLQSTGVPTRYWKLTPDQLDLQEMSPAEKLALDSDPVSVANAQAAALLSLSNFSGNFLDSRYNNILRDSLIGMHTLACAARQKHRRDYIAGFLLWLDSVVTYVDTVQDSINAATDVPTILAITFDFTPFVATDPMTDIGEAVRRKAVSF